MFFFAVRQAGKRGPKWNVGYLLQHSSMLKLSGINFEKLTNICVSSHPLEYLRYFQVSLQHYGVHFLSSLLVLFGLFSETTFNIDEGHEVLV